MTVNETEVILAAIELVTADLSERATLTFAEQQLVQSVIVLQKQEGDNWR